MSLPTVGSTSWPSNRILQMRPKLRAADLPSTIASFGSWTPREEPVVFSRVQPIVDTVTGRSAYGVSVVGGRLSQVADTVTGRSAYGASVQPVINLVTTGRLQALLATLGPVWWLAGGEVEATRALVAEGGKLEFTLRLWELAAEAWQTYTAGGRGSDGDSAAARVVLASMTSARQDKSITPAYSTSGEASSTLLLLRAEFSRLISEHALVLRSALNTAASDAELALVAERKMEGKIAGLLAERRMEKELRDRMTVVASPTVRDGALCIIVPSSSSSAFSHGPQHSPLGLGDICCAPSRGMGGGAGVRYTSPQPLPSLVSNEPVPSAMLQNWQWRGAFNSELDEESTSMAQLKGEVSVFRNRLKGVDNSKVKLKEEVKGGAPGITSPIAYTQSVRLKPRRRHITSNIDNSSISSEFNNNARLYSTASNARGPIVFAASSLLSPALTRSHSNNALSETRRVSEASPSPLYLSGLSHSKLASLSSVTSAFSLYEASGSLLEEELSLSDRNLPPHSARLSPDAQRSLSVRIVQSRLGHSQLDKLLGVS